MVLSHLAETACVCVCVCVCVYLCVCVCARTCYTLITYIYMIYIYIYIYIHQPPPHDNSYGSSPYRRVLVISFSTATSGIPDYPDNNNNNNNNDDDALLIRSWRGKPLNSQLIYVLTSSRDTYRNPSPLHIAELHVSRASRSCRSR